MKLIVGLGNPGVGYKDNRHNLGFMIMDAFARNRGLSWRYSQDFMCYYIKSKDFVLVKPVTYMNKSGVSILSVCQYFDIEHKDMLIVHDELDLDFGKIRLAFDGSAAGHKGVESVIEILGTPDFARLRMGIGQVPTENGDGKTTDADKYVLEPFSKEEQSKLPEVIQRCQEAIVSCLDLGIEATMNKFN